MKKIKLKIKSFDTALSSKKEIVTASSILTSRIPYARCNCCDEELLKEHQFVNQFYIMVVRVIQEPVIQVQLFRIVSMNNSKLMHVCVPTRKSYLNSLEIVIITLFIKPTVNQYALNVKRLIQ